MHTAPGDPDCSATGSKHPSGSVPCGDALGSASLHTSSAHQPCVPAVHGFCLSHALLGAGCFLVHSQPLVVCMSLDTVGAVQTLVCSLAIRTFSEEMAIFAHVCVYVCVCDPCTCVRVPVCKQRPEEDIGCHTSSILFLIPVSRDLSLNLEPGW